MSKQTKLIVVLISINLCACTTKTTLDSNPILDFNWETDVYNIMYATVKDVDNLRFWVRRAPSSREGASYNKVCVEVEQPRKANIFYVANLNTYGVQEVYNCQEGYWSVNNIVSDSRHRSFGHANWVNVENVSARLLDKNIYQFTFESLFPVNHYKLTKEGKTTLNNVVRQVRHWPVKRINIFGVADSSGGYSHNQFLANARAQAVKDYLIEVGVDQIPIYLRGSVENGLPSADERITQRRFMIEVNLSKQ